MAAIRATELQQQMDADSRLAVIDLRGPDEYDGGTIPGAWNIPYASGVASRLARELGRKRPVVLVCGWGHKSAMTGIALKRLGFRGVRYLEGGMENWGLAGLMIERGALAFRRGMQAAEPERMRAAAGE